MANTYDLPKNYIKIVEEAKLLPGKPFLRYVQEGQKYLIEKQSLDKYSNQAIIRHTLTIPTMFRTSLMSDMVVACQPFLDSFIKIIPAQGYLEFQSDDWQPSSNFLL